MAWYRDGKVNVTINSKNVVGVGTAWLGQVLAGEGFDAPDGRIYEVAEVINNTSLVLTGNYIGATAENEAYQIVPNASMTKVLTQRVGALVGSFEADLQNAFKREHHTGTQKLDSISDAGTAAAMNALGAGGIIERGSNANGEYVRFADGTQICTRSISGYEAGVSLVNFSAAFIGAPSVAVSISPVEGWDKELGIYGSNSQWVIYLANTHHTNSLQLLAIGRFK